MEGLIQWNFMCLDNINNKKINCAICKVCSTDFFNSKVIPIFVFVNYDFVLFNLLMQIVSTGMIDRSAYGIWLCHGFYFQSVNKKISNNLFSTNKIDKSYLNSLGSQVVSIRFSTTANIANVFKFGSKSRIFVSLLSIKNACS